MSKEDKLQILRKLMMRENFRKLTPMCIAGNEGNYDSLRILLKFFRKNKEILKIIFKNFIREDREQVESPGRAKFHIRVFKE